MDDGVNADFEYNIDRAETAFLALAEKKDKLWELCKEFIAEQEISCAESVAQSDRVIENAYDFIEGICDLVGYHEYDDE